MMHLVMNLLEGFYSYFTVEVGHKPLFYQKIFYHFTFIAVTDH